MREIGFELEHGVGGQNLEGPEILCMIPTILWRGDVWQLLAQRSCA